MSFLVVKYYRCDKRDGPLSHRENNKKYGFLFRVKNVRINKEARNT